MLFYSTKNRIILQIFAAIFSISTVCEHYSIPLFFFLAPFLPDFHFFMDLFYSFYRRELQIFYVGKQQNLTEEGLLEDT